MRKKIAIAVIHGMGSQSSDFAEPMISEINSRISNANKQPEKIAWKSIFWADVLEKRQRTYLSNAKDSGDLKLMKLRKFVVTSFGDATAYQKVDSQFNTTYNQIHTRIQNRISDLFQNDLQSKEVPLIIMAHSLGGHMISNYIWDRQKNNNADLSPFEKMETLAGMITFGCNIPLFTFAYQKIMPINFLDSQVSTAIKKKAKWLNFYDPDDVLGYPLKPINPSYDKVVSEDIPINVGGILTSWNPISHTQYWTDNSFTRPATKLIASFL